MTWRHVDHRLLRLVYHIITDGGNACILATRLADELESGRVLAEYELPPTRRSRKQKETDAEQSTEQPESAADTE